MCRLRSERYNFILLNACILFPTTYNKISYILRNTEKHIQVNINQIKYIQTKSTCGSRLSTQIGPMPLGISQPPSYKRYLHMYDL